MTADPTGCRRGRPRCVHSSRYGAIERWLPSFLRRQVLHFEARIDDAVAAFAAGLPAGSWVLDAGAGECRHAALFSGHRYVTVDLGVGDAAWDYASLDCLADLASLPLASSCFDACLNIVTLEHLPEPAKAIGELARVLRPGGRLLIVVPMSWEIHQAPHDYFRYTRHGMEYLLAKAGFTDVAAVPVGGFFRLLSRRLFNALAFFPRILFPLIALLVAPAALLLPLLEPLDRARSFTLGYICTARKSS